MPLLISLKSLTSGAMTTIIVIMIVVVLKKKNQKEEEPGIRADIAIPRKHCHIEF